MSNQTNEALNLINQAKMQARNESLKKFFIKNGKNFMRLVTIIIITVIIFFAFKSYQKSQQAKYSAILHESLLNQQIGNLAEAKKNLKTIYDAKSAPNGVRSLAALRYGSMLLDEGKKSEATKVYLEINSCGSCDDYIRDLTGLLAVKVWLSDENQVQKKDLNADIEKIENNSKILRYYIAEQRATLELQKNNLQKAYQIFDAIAKNPESSQVLKARARDALKMIIAQGYKPEVTLQRPKQNEEKNNLQKK
jgi:hypothetical protein